MIILISIINLIYTVLLILFIAQMILSFARVSPYDPTWGPIIRFIHLVTEPILQPIRRYIPPMGGLDISPIIVLLGLSLLRRLLFGFM
jgi:YggT family protein